MNHSKNLIKLLLCLLPLLPLYARAQEQKPIYNATLEGYKYPYDVKYFPVKVEGQSYKMAYMDVAPTKKVTNPQTVMLLHGKNFLGAYWAKTIAYLTAQGYRVIVPDQLGFGKSDKPAIYYNFHQMAYNTRQLLQQLGINQVAVVGHSMGGMVATRFALMYPEITTKLVLENPIGLEDYRLFVPFKTMDELYEVELKRTAEATREYHRTYYTAWAPAYDEWVEVTAAQFESPNYPQVAKAAALTYAMIYQQPVVYEFGQLKMPALVLVGKADRTIVGKGFIKDKAVVQAHGQYPELGRKTADAIPGAKLVELDNVGHIPHLEATAKFHKALLSFLQ
ncbi:alpha/beta fold hydrolase [Pontibacter liquoris]|uniref:alpha/beta fold hydrolase n=1 Tax=Pontibacter liquoris TaxID=2905677 RepID=UPI001FA72E6E|nr:alpha/beta hydrolase [Pontibacter liquoris]